MTLTEQIPGLREAIEREQFNRVVAFLDFPETVCGVELRHLTLRDILLLQSIGSPFVTGGNVGAIDALAFLKLQCTPRSQLSRWAMLRVVASRYSTVEVVHAIQEFIEEAFADAPPTDGGSGGPQYWTMAHSLVHVFGKNYGWPQDETLRHPIKTLFPLLNIIRQENNPGAAMFNPLSDRVRGEWLNSVNRN